MKLDPQLTYISILRDKNGALQIHSSAPLNVCFTDYDKIETEDKDMLFTLMQCAAIEEPYKYEYSLGAVDAK